LADIILIACRAAILDLRAIATTGEIRGMRGELSQFDKRMTENNSSLRSEIVSLRNEMQSEIRALITRIESVATEVNTRIDALTQRLEDALNVRERLLAVEPPWPGATVKVKATNSVVTGWNSVTPHGRQVIVLV
jgi:septal ring factor EnvC (AmiA/AmiB activator)